MKAATKKTLFNILKNLLFLAIGIVLFMWVYKGYDMSRLWSQLTGFNVWFIMLSIAFSILSNISRTMRWNQLLEPMGYKVNSFNAFLSVQLMYLANLIIPRAGEIARCTVLTKYEDVPFSKLLGTVIIERIADALALFIIAFFAIITQIPTIKAFFINNPESLEKMQSVFSLKNLYYLIALMVAGILAIYVFRKSLKNTKFYVKVIEVLKGVFEGVKTIMKLKRPLLFVAHTLFIYLMWLLMLYVFFVGYPPTQDLGIFSAATVFVMSGLAMIAPVQAGMGAYHFMVASTLVLYGVPLALGKDFAFIIHTATNLYLAIFGLLALGILFFYNKKRKKTAIQ
jgi:glycosyltransferase 2 family protein